MEKDNKGYSTFYQTFEVKNNLNKKKNSMPKIHVINGSAPSAGKICDDVASSFVTVDLTRSSNSFEIRHGWCVLPMFYTVAQKQSV